MSFEAPCGQRDTPKYRLYKQRRNASAYLTKELLKQTLHAIVSHLSNSVEVAEGGSMWIPLNDALGLSSYPAAWVRLFNKRFFQYWSPYDDKLHPFDGMIWEVERHIYNIQLPGNSRREKYWIRLTEPVESSMISTRSSKEGAEARPKRGPLDQGSRSSSSSISSTCSSSGASMGSILNPETDIRLIKAGIRDKCNRRVALIANYKRGVRRLRVWFKKVVKDSLFLQYEDQEEHFARRQRVIEYRERKAKGLEVMIDKKTAVSGSMEGKEMIRILEEGSQSDRVPYKEALRQWLKTMPEVLGSPVEAFTAGLVWCYRKKNYPRVAHEYINMYKNQELERTEEEQEEEMEDQREEEEKLESEGLKMAHFMWVDQKMTQQTYVRFRRIRVSRGDYTYPPLYRVIRYFKSLFPPNPRDGKFAGRCEPQWFPGPVYEQPLHRWEHQYVDHANEGYGLMKHIEPKFLMDPILYGAYVRVSTYFKMILRPIHDEVMQSIGEKLGEDWSDNFTLRAILSYGYDGAGIDTRGMDHSMDGAFSFWLFLSFFFLFFSPSPPLD